MATDDWSFKEFRPNDSDQRWFFRKNMRPLVVPGDPRFPYVAYVTLSYEPRDSSGLPASADEALLFEIEEHVIPRLESEGEAIQVGAVLKAGVKDLVLYVQRPESLEGLLATLRQRYPHFGLDHQIGSDPRWEHYADLP